MARQTKRGTCPYCLAPLWRDFGEIMEPILDVEPLRPDEVIPALKARRELYYKIDAYRLMFGYVDPLPLARQLAAGGAPPSNLYVVHQHHGFKANDEPEYQPPPEEPGF